MPRRGQHRRMPALESHRRRGDTRRRWPTRRLASGHARRASVPTSCASSTPEIACSSIVLHFFIVRARAARAAAVPCGAAAGRAAVRFSAPTASPSARDAVRGRDAGGAGGGAAQAQHGLLLPRELPAAAERRRGRGSWAQSRQRAARLGRAEARREPRGEDGAAMRARGMGPARRDRPAMLDCFSTCPCDGHRRGRGHSTRRCDSATRVLDPPPATPPAIRDWRRFANAMLDEVRGSPLSAMAHATMPRHPRLGGSTNATVCLIDTPGVEGPSASWRGRARGIDALWRASVHRVACAPSCLWRRRRCSNATERLAAATARRAAPPLDLRGEAEGERCARPRGTWRERGRTLTAGRAQVSRPRTARRRRPRARRASRRSLRECAARRPLRRRGRRSPNAERVGQRARGPRPLATRRAVARMRRVGGRTSAAARLRPPSSPAPRRPRTGDARAWTRSRTARARDDAARSRRGAAR